MRHALALIAALMTVPAAAGRADSQDWARLRAHDVVIAAEIHDNPHHHRTQVVIARAIAPRALVFEMLSPEQAARITPGNRADREALRDLLGWDASGWPDFAFYHPIMTAAPDAVIRGAHVPRADARKAMQAGPAAAGFADAAETFGLDRPLPATEQAAREAFQIEAHCNALPREMAAGMVAVQRLRDAVLARAALDALDETGGPVLVITGNGHARADWGVPAYLSRVRPDARVFTIGQAESPGGAPAGRFDLVVQAPAAVRDDPCAGFQ